MNPQTFMIICRAFFPNCEFNEIPGWIRVIFKRRKVLSISYVVSRYYGIGKLISEMHVSEHDLVEELRSIKDNK